MNKDVIYIEPEDDITDIITKIEKAKNKIVALVPPKKAGVFRSIVNIKLIAKAGASAEKNVVIVTTDPSIVKLAAATKLPVTESLQSAPSVPTVSEAEEPSETVVTEVADEAAEEEAAKTETEPTTEEVNEESEAETETEADTEEPAPKTAEKAEKTTKPKKANKFADNKVVNWIKEHRNLSIFAAIFVLVLIIALIWAFGVAPAAEVNVSIKTEKKNFSQNITFTDNLADEDAKEGKFYLEQKKIEDVKEVTFEATGKKNLGEKATGDVVVYAYFKEKGTTPVAAGSIFTINGLSYVSNETVNISWDGTSLDVCDNRDNASSLLQSGCSVSARVNVTATQNGQKYNIAASNKGWDTVAPVGVYSDKAMTGGSDNIVTVVQQSDIEQAKEELAAESENANKQKLYATINSDEEIIIEASFKQETSDATSTPAIDAEVKDGETPTLKVTTTVTVYVIDKAKLEEFINEKVTLGDDQKIYEIVNLRVENFAEAKEATTAKLKANYFVGPKITEGELVEKILGKGLGDATRKIRDIYGVSDVDIQASYPWVSSIPGDSNKVTVRFEIKDQEGNSVKTTNNTDNDTDDEDAE